MLAIPALNLEVWRDSLMIWLTRIFEGLLLLGAALLAMHVLGNILRRRYEALEREELRTEVYRQHGLKQIWPERERRSEPRLDKELTQLYAEFQREVPEGK